MRADQGTEWMINNWSDRLRMRLKKPCAPWRKGLKSTCTRPVLTGRPRHKWRNLIEQSSGASLQQELPNPMKRCVAALTFLFSIASVTGWAQSSSIPRVTLWPHNRAAAISLTFDDAMQSQLDSAGPILRKHHLTGTFFVITGPSGTWLQRFDDWKRLAAQGNEIGSHTVNHPCLLAEIEPHSQDHTPEMMRGEIQQSAREIVARLGTQRGLTFAYPCGNMSFGSPVAHGRNQALYIDYVAESYFAARGYDGVGTVSPEKLNILTVPDLGATAEKDFPSLLAKMEPAVRERQWGIFTFHGVGGQWLSVSPEALEELASYLERHQEIWTAPFGDVIRYIQESKALSIQRTESEGRCTRFVLGWPLHPRLFDLPLTLKWDLPAGWTACQAEADGRPLTCETAMESDRRIVLVDVPAQAKVVELSRKVTAKVRHGFDARTSSGKVFALRLAERRDTSPRTADEVSPSSQFNLNIQWQHNHKLPRRTARLCFSGRALSVSEGNLKRDAHALQIPGRNYSACPLLLMFPSGQSDKTYESSDKSCRLG
jgi:peptidoglycan/xylan/chitin deacetylase (PgdA/CDA1 family)